MLQCSCVQPHQSPTSHTLQGVRTTLRCGTVQNGRVFFFSRPPSIRTIALRQWQHVGKDVVRRWQDLQYKPAELHQMSSGVALSCGWENLCRYGDTDARSQLSSSPDGPRAAHLRRTAEGLWDAVESLVQATTSPCEAALPRELARVSACRELLEADFATYLRREYGHSQSVGTRQLAEQHARIHFVSAGGDMDRWAVAYLCLRAGDVQAFCETARAQLGDLAWRGVGMIGGKSSYVG